MPVAVVALGKASHTTLSVTPTAEPRVLPYCANDPEVFEHAVPFSVAKKYVAYSYGVAITVVFCTSTLPSVAFKISICVPPYESAFGK